MTGTPEDPAGPEDRVFQELAAKLSARSSRRIPEEDAARRAAVALLLAGPSLTADLSSVLDPRRATDSGRDASFSSNVPGTGSHGGRSGGSGDSGGPWLPEPWRPYHALLILRPRVEGDPWSGHVALPGGKREPHDADLVDTARRETAEETGLLVPRDDVLGRLSDIHPRSAHLPDLAIRPYVVRWRGGGDLSLNHEVEAAFWVPLPVLTDPERRSELVLERRQGRRRFPTIEVGEHTVWGLTHAILDDFLSLIADRPPPER